MDTKDSIGNVLRSISRRNPALQLLATDALESLSTDEFSVSDQVELAKRIAISSGIDLDIGEEDPDMLLSGLSDAVIRLAEKLAISESATFVDYEEPTDAEIDTEYSRAKELRKTLKSFNVAQTKCSISSGFWDRIPTPLHYIYADMLVDLCQLWQVDPLTAWDEKARG